MKTVKVIFMCATFSVALGAFTVFTGNRRTADVPAGWRDAPNSSSAHKQNPYDCNWQKQYLQGRLESRTSVGQTLASLLRKPPTIIFIGEQHTDYVSIDQYPELVQTIQKIVPEVNCLFLEAKSTHQDAIDSYLTGRGSFAETIAPYQRGDYTPLAAARKDLLDSARRSGLNIFAVDVQANDSALRDEAMSGGIIQHLRNGECSKGIMIVGKAHLVERDYSKKYPPIPARLWDQGITSVSINVMTDSSIEMGAMGYECPERVSLPRGAFGFFPIQPSPAIGSKYPMPGARPVFWSDYAATLVLAK